MKRKVPMRSRGINHKLVVAYAMMYVIPMMYLLHAIGNVLEDIRLKTVISSPALMVLVLAIVTGLIMSIAAFLLIYRAMKPIREATKNVESFFKEVGEERFSLVPSNDEPEKISEYISSMITELRKKINDAANYTQHLDDAQLKLVQVALKDSLTGLYNQNYVSERLKAEVTRAREFDCAVSILLIDIDDFKKYNEAFGHALGDNVLKKIAQVVAENIRSIDIPSRYGGEEFLVIMPEAGKRGAYDAAEEIRKAIAEQKFVTNVQGKTTGLTVSIGTAGYPESRATVEIILSAAQSRLSEAKKAGKNRVLPQYTETTKISR